MRLVDEGDGVEMLVLTAAIVRKTLVPTRR